MACHAEAHPILDDFLLLICQVVGIHVLKQVFHSAAGTAHLLSGPAPVSSGESDKAAA